MNIFPLIGLGVSTQNSSGNSLDVRYHLILNKNEEFLNTSDIEMLDATHIQCLLRRLDAINGVNAKKHNSFMRRCLSYLSPNTRD